jgi:hypothetical protein
VIGNTYSVSFKFSPTTTLEEIAVVTNNFGFNFSTHQYYDTDNFPINISHFSIDTIVPITGQWYEVSEIFEADSNYQFFHIGNFYTNQETSAIPASENAFHSYYLVDEVVISSSLNQVSHDKLKPRVFPNPTRGFLHIQNSPFVEITRISVLNSSGITVYQEDKLNYENLIKINITNLPNGVYTILFETPKTISYEKVIKID